MACGLLVLASIGWIAFRNTPDPRAPLVVTEARRASLRPVDHLVLSPDGLKRGAAEGDPAARAGRIVGFVDADLRTPVDVVVSTESRDVDLVDVEPGRLLVSAPVEDWEHGIPIRASAPLYERVETVLGRASSNEIPLVPAARSRIHVTSGGTVVRPVRVVLTHGEGAERTALDGLVEELPDGGIAFVHAQPLTAHVYGGRGTLLFSAPVSPRSDLWIADDATFPNLRLVGEDGLPAAGVPLTTGSVAVGITDGEGRVVLPEISVDALRLRLESNRLRFTPTDRQVSGVEADGRDATVLAALLGTGTVDIVVEPAVNRLRFVDQSTGEPAEGTAFLAKRLVLEHREPIEAVLYRNGLEGGWMEVPYGFADGGPPGPATRFLVTVPGYDPFLLPQDAYPFAPLDPPDRSFALTPVEDGAWLRVIDLGVAIDAGTLTLHAEGTGEQLFTGDLSSRVAYGPFRDPGGAIRVASVARGLLGVALLSGANEYALEIGAHLGSLRIEGANWDLPPLVCMDARRSLWRSTTNNGRSCLFERLPAGRYIPGPEEKVLQIASSPEALEGVAVDVRAGEVTVVQADPDWVSASAVTGRLIVRDGLPAPRLLVSYASPVGPLIVRETSCWAWTQPDGTYEIVGGAVPEALIAVERRGGLFRPRGVFEPGGTYVLDERALELSSGRSDAQPEIVDVTFRHGPDWTELPIVDALREVDVRLTVGTQPVRLAVHSSVDRVDVRRLRDGSLRTIKLARDPEDVDLSRLFAEQEPAPSSASNQR